MRYIKVISIVSLGMLILIGCADPKPKPSSSNILQVRFIDGKPYRVPRSSVAVSYSNMYDSQPTLKGYNLICRTNDALWMDLDASYEYIRLYKTKNSIAAYAYLGKISQVRRAGCVHPLSNQEYNYYRTKETERYNRLVQLANMPTSETVNVNVTGTMHHTY